MIIPLQEVRKIEIEREQCEIIKQQLDSYKLLATLNKKAIETNENRNSKQEEKTVILEDTPTEKQKRFPRIRAFTQKHKGKIYFVGGFLGGAILTNRIIKH